MTGSKGFIGTALQKKLEKLGHDVYGFDIKTSIGHEDIRDRVNCYNAIKQIRPDVIIHLAALTGVRNSLLNPEDYFETNITGT